MYTKIRPEWKDKTAVIFASGPSVTDKDIETVRKYRTQDKCRVIAINAMYQKVDYADLLYFCDFKFYKWHMIDTPDPIFKDYPAPKYSITPQKFITSDIHRLRKHSEEGYGLSRECDALAHGKNSGYQCLNLAFLFGVKRIIMVGYDMKPDENGKTHCHGPHFIPTPVVVYKNITEGGYYESIATELQKEGVEVINTSMDSALCCFTKMPLKDILV